MLTKFKRAVAKQFLGDVVLVTRKVYQSDDGKCEVHLGLYQKGNVSNIYFKIVSRAFMSHHSSGMGIEVPSFGWLASELDAAVNAYEQGTLPRYQYPKLLGFLWRFITTTPPLLLLEFEGKHDRHRFIAYHDRKQKAVVSYENRDNNIVFDYAGFVAMRDELLAFAGE